MNSKNINANQAYSQKQNPHRLHTIQQQQLLNNPSQIQQNYKQRQNPSPQLPSMNTSQHEQEQIHYNYNLAEQPALTEQQGVNFKFNHFLNGL